MLFVSYIPLLTTPAGIIKPPEQKQELMDMLTDAASAYPIKAIAWIRESETHSYPLLIMPFASDICEHMMEWSGNKPERYFTLIWNTHGENGYSIVILPNFDKSARRWHAMTRRQDRLTILGHVFTYVVIQSEGFNRNMLEGLDQIRVGFTAKAPEVCGSDGEIEDYSELTMRCRNFYALDAGERESIAPYFKIEH